MKDNSTLNKVLPQLGEFYNKDKGARFVLKYAGSFPPEIINTIRFEDMVKIFDQFGNETKRVYDFVIGGTKYELKAWTRWAPWSDEAFLNQFVKDISSIDNLKNLQWIFMKTEDINSITLHQYVINALNNSKGREALSKVNIVNIRKIPTLENVINKNKVDMLVDFFIKKENFDIIFKVVDL